MAMTKCKECKNAVSTSAKACPHCGAVRPGGEKNKGTFGWMVGLCLAAVLIYTVVGNSERSTSTSAASKRGGFTADDFVFDSYTRRHRDVIVAGVNKVHRERSQCVEVDPASAYIAADRGTLEDPMFFVTCSDGSSYFNVYFAKSYAMR